MKVFVFGSNLAGIHGAGAARTAHKHHGAIWHQGFGHHGNSFAIPTKDNTIHTLPLDRVKGYVEMFIAYAKANPELKFQVTRIGCGLAGYRDEQIAPLFFNAPVNCEFDLAWEGILGSDRAYWGAVW